jgi:hypothetical protein
MVRLEIKDHRGIRGILTDGFMPDFLFLKEIDWKKTKENKLSTRPDFLYGWNTKTFGLDRIYDKYLRPECDIPQLLTQSVIYQSLIYSLRDRFCYKPEIRREICVHRLYPGRGFRSLRTKARFYKGKVHATKEWRVVPTFYEEIEHDEAKGISNYGISILLLNQAPHEQCKVFEECQGNWMDFLNFKIKDQNTYKDFEKYKEAAKGFLQNNINYAVEYAWLR